MVAGGSDFQPASGTLTWTDGEDGAKTFQVRLLADTVTEPVETINLTLSAPNGASLGSPSTATMSITNVAPTPTARRRAVRR